jgi:hypothetical protein
MPDLSLEFASCVSSGLLFDFFEYDPRGGPPACHESLRALVQRLGGTIRDIANLSVTMARWRVEITGCDISEGAELKFAYEGGFGDVDTLAPGDALYFSVSKGPPTARGRVVSTSTGDTIFMRRGEAWRIERVSKKVWRVLGKVE